MPRQSRLDAPGLLHHVIARGIERREIFRDDRDRETFVQKLGELANASGARCYAWCLLSNHFHLLLKSGERPLPWLMRRLMTGHAVRYNLRHSRSGHLFQNRYKSIVAEEEPHFLELVRYIALNPVRAATVRSAEELDAYPWSGHAVLVGRRDAPWQDKSEVLARFGNSEGVAVGRYREFVIAGWDQGRREDLRGGGLVRSAGSVEEVARRRRPEDREAADERVLGSGEFVEAVWEAAEAGIPRAAAAWKGWEEILSEVAATARLEPTRILGGSRERQVSRARRRFLLRCLLEAGVSMAQLGRLCGINEVSVARAIEKARVEASTAEEREGE